MITYALTLPYSYIMNGRYTMKLTTQIQYFCQEHRDGRNMSGGLSKVYDF